MAGGQKPKIQWAVSLFLLVILYFSVLPAQAQYGGGGGTAENPFLIYTAEQMNAIGVNPDDFDKHFKLMADIDLSSYTGTDFNIIGVWDNAFTGVFDGHGHTISNFTYTCTDRYDIGLFGYVGWRAEIRDLGLINPNVDAGTGGSAGSLVGSLSQGTISNCYVEDGSVSGVDDIGGLVGFNLGTITSCYSTASVSGYWFVGGLVGQSAQPSTIINCYSTGSVSGDESVGGLAGLNLDTITNCYATGSVTGSADVGGLVGDNSSFFGSDGTTSNSFWDIETSGQLTSTGGTGKTTTEMQMESTFFGWWDGSVWKIDEGKDYPRLWWEKEPGGAPEIQPLSDFLTGVGTEDEPYLIYTAEQMNLIGLYEQDWDKHFKLMDDIDLSSFRGTDFNIIGYFVGSDSPVNKAFTGVFDGNGKKILNFSCSSTGLFGHIDGPDAEIKDLGLINPNINAGAGKSAGSLAGYLADGIITGCCVEGGRVTGMGEVGGLVGENGGTIMNCYSTASVSGDGDIGGLVGYNLDGTIINCYSSGSATGTANVGGLAGYNWDGVIINCHSSGSVSGNWEAGGLVGVNWSIITNCYSTGSVVGSNHVGGLVGLDMLGDTTNSFWDIETSGQETSQGGTGKTTNQMQTESTFTNVGWDFVGETVNGSEDVWRILEGQNYPRLWWENEPGQAPEIQPDQEPEEQPDEEPEKQPEEKPEIQTLSDYLTGAGTQDDSYLIYTAEEMNLIGLCEKDWDKNFRLMADIDLSGYTGPDFNIIGYWVALDSPENRPFKGVFDGNGHTISNFTYTSTDIDHIGLFGYIEDPDAEIKDLGLIDPNIDAGTEGGDVGSLTGYIREGTITRCYVEGGKISGGMDVGGLLGSNWEGTITHCYSNVSVSGNEEVGGLAGLNGGPVSNCYSTGSVSGGEWVGGLVGLNWGTITNCYSTGHVEGTVDVCGLVGYGGGAIASFWDIETSGQPSSAGGIGKTTAEMQTASTFVGWSFGPVWTIDEGNDYPRLWWEKEPGEAPERQYLSDFLSGAGTENEPYLIYTAEELNAIGLFPNDWDKHFKLMADIDLAGLKGRDFNIIGISPDSAFTGVFDGNGKKIKNFTYTSMEALNVGLFGYLKSTAVIKDLGLINPNVDTGIYEMGGWGVGSLVGLIGDGTIISCYVEGGSVTGGWMVGLLIGYVEDGAVTDCYVEGGSVSGEDEIGGLVGSNQDTITDCYAICSVSCNNVGGVLVGSNTGAVTNCYSAGSVTGNEWIGGLSGSNFAGEITNCFSTVSVSGSNRVGGLSGSNDWSGTVTNCYARGDISGNESVGGLVGENTSFFGFETTITNCYSAGHVDGTTNVGGLVGVDTLLVDFDIGPLFDFNLGTISNSFWDIETSGQTTSAGGTGKTTAEMQTRSTFTNAGWDFTNETANGTEDIWWILEGQDYPRLWWEQIEE